ncbi:MAG: hypothetical protein U0176_05690 [Bacteroidia bacterium]
MHKRFILWMFLVIGMAFTAHSQVAISPYSYYGLGDIFSSSSARSFGMGRIGIGSYDNASVNRLNPASLADLRLTTFDFNGFVTTSNQKSNLNSQTVSTSGFHNVSLAFSNRRGYGIVVGLAPYSSVGYDVRVRDSIQADTSVEAYTARYAGSGGLNQLYVGFGVRFLKRVQAGVNLSYAFGSTNYQWFADYDDGTILTGAAERSVALRGFLPQFGLQYGDTLKLKVKVSRVKEIEDQIQDLQNERENLDKEMEAVKSEASKGDAKDQSKQAKADALEKEKAALEEQVKSLGQNERANSKEIGKLQDKIYRLDKKRKKLTQDMKARKKEVTDAEARINLRRDRIAQRITALEQEKKDVESGKKEGTVTKTQRILVRGGATFDPGISMNGTELYRYNNSIIQDTLYADTGKVTMPSKLGFGFSIARPNKWMVGADVSLQDWSKFSYFGDPSTLTNSLQANVGGEWIPELGSNKYARKIAYRFGAYYHGTFLNLQGSAITEMGITAGVGLPIGFFNPIGQSYSRINVGVNVGRRGTLENNLLQELTLQFRLGVNLNDIWFIKRRID